MANPKGISWVNSRKQFLQSVKIEVRKRLGSDPRDISRARTALRRELAKPYTVSSKAELIGQVELSDIVYGGDFHAYAQAQRTHLRLLRSIERPVVLALECFTTSAQKIIDSYLQGKISIDELRLRSKWDKEWGFPFVNYQPLFELAKVRQMRIVALREKKQVTGDLSTVDRLVAERIKAEFQLRPESLIYAIYGELHLHNKGLPFQVRKILRGKVKDLTIHINPEQAYFHLARRQQELSVDVIKYRNGDYAVLSAPPWVPWQNYLLYLDYIDGRGDAEDLNLAEEPDDFHLAAPEATDHVARFAGLLMGDLGIRLDLSSLSVHPTGDSHIISEIQRVVPRGQWPIGQHLLARGRSFLLAESVTAHLASAAVNHAAHLAGLVIHQRMSGSKRTPWNFPTDFERAVWCEAVGFYMSKQINHKRRPNSLTDIKSQLLMDVSGSEGSREALKIALEMRMNEVLLLHGRKQRQVRFKPRQKSSFVDASRILGGMMGERLFLALRTGKVKKGELVAWLKFDIDNKEFIELYRSIVLKLGNQFDQKIKSKRDRL